MIVMFAGIQGFVGLVQGRQGNAVNCLLQSPSPKKARSTRQFKSKTRRVSTETTLPDSNCRGL